MSFKDTAFVSYHTSNKETAGKLKNILSKVGIDGFLAHEDIHVSEEWRLKILEELGKASIFICLLCKDYLVSPWCAQESGIAAFRGDMTIIPLSIDGTIPIGFIGNIQSTKIDKDNFSIIELIPGLIKHDKEKALNVIIAIIGQSGNYRSAEANFQLILPYIDDLSEPHMVELLKHIRENDQIHHASLCASKFIPSILEKYGHLLADGDLEYLKEICSNYSS